ncbi:MAG: V-type ATPase subunit a family protein [Bacteroides sp.]|nr:V-type ATPase subunit a family protein [Bacteroides sp.]MCM1379924.1 V-type ATPase subunit a family protein [Bacteroides sp.]MCM1446221.1 V-type ATPase subunit a family protein [Prevotella sp.]
MKYLKLLLLLAVLSPLNLLADKPKGGPKGGDKERTEWFRKLKAAKHNFMVKELDLTEAQQADFFRLYDAKESERHEAERKVRNLEKEIKKKGAAAIEEDYNRAITAQYQLNHELAKIESKYESEFRKVITKRQLYKLRHVEFEFQRKLMQQEKGKK